MKREGTGDPRAPDIAFTANVKMRELNFERVPDPEVRFRGNTRRNSVWESRRENLPDEVEEGVVYREAEVRLRIASEVAEANGGLTGEGGREKVNAGFERGTQKTTVVEQAKSKEETE